MRLEFTFESTANAVVAPATGVYQIVDFQLELTIIELSDEGENMVRSNYNYPQTPLYLHGTSWRHYVSSLPTSAGQYSTLVPARFASVKSLVCLPRKTLAAVGTTFYLSSRVNPNIQQYLWRIGSSIVPSKSVYLEGTNTAP